MSPLSLARTVVALPPPARVLFVGTFINRFGNFLGPFLVLYLTSKGDTAGQAGLSLGVVGLGNTAGNALGGTLADRLGRRTTIVLSMAGSGACTLAVPLVGPLVAVIALVGLVGVFAQLYRPAAGALLLDVVPDAQRVTAFAVYRLAINLGMALGPAVAGLLASRSYAFLFVGDAATSFLFGALALTRLPETAPRGGDARGRGAGYRAVLHDRPYLLLLVAMGAAFFIYVQSTTTLPLRVKDAGLPPSVYGLLLGLNALAVVLVELPLTAYTRRKPMRPVIATGLVLLGVGFALTGVARTAVALAATVLVWTLAEMIYSPAASAYTGRFAPPLLRGRYQGAYGIAQMAAGAVGPVVGGYLYMRDPAALWAVCGVVGIVAALLILAVKPHHKNGHT